MLRISTWVGVCALVPMVGASGSLGGEHSTSHAVSTSQAAQPRVLLLATDGALASGKRLPLSLLDRELLRQGVLLAAREEMGLATRDTSLREVAEKDLDTTWPIMVTIRSARKRDGHVIVELCQGPKGRYKVLLRKEFEIPVESPEHYLEMARQVEILARSNFVKAFKKAGFESPGGQDKTFSAPLPETVLEALGEINFIAQYGAVRRLHTLRSDQGSYPANTGALVRGYANLGLLTDRYWTTFHKAFKARAMLYAERMVHRYGEHPWTLAHRAYARALTGLPGAALEDIEKARRLAQKGTTSVEGGNMMGTLPAWVEIVEAFCRTDNPRLVHLAKLKSQDSSLAMLLNFVTYEYEPTNALTILIGEEAFELCPDCFRLIDVLSDSQLGVERHYSSLAGELLERSIQTRCAMLPDFPNDVRAVGSRRSEGGFFSRLFKAREASKRDNARAVLVDALLKAGQPSTDNGEPSWAVLGRLIEEITFMQAYRRAHVLKHSLGVDAADFVEQALTQIPHHPYRNFIETFAIPEGHDLPRVRELLADVNIVDVDVQMKPLVDATRILEKPGPHQGYLGWRESFLNDDEIAGDLVGRSLHGDYQRHASIARRLQEVSPHCPRVAVLLIQSKWESAQKEEETWVKQWPYRAEIFETLGKHYYDKGNTYLAAKYFRKAIEISPDFCSYDYLAGIYKYLDRPDKFVETFESFLEQPSYGLAPARAYQRVADYYMCEEQWDKALPYAREAADSYSGRGLDCLARCYEGLGDLAHACDLRRRLAERYESSAYTWFFWCKRTGYGTAKEARELAESYFRARAGNTDGEFPDLYGVFLLLTGDAEQAMKVFREQLDRSKEPYSGIQAALIADAHKRSAFRDECLQQVGQHGKEYRYGGQTTDYLIDLALLFQEALKPEGSLDLAAVEEMLAACDQGQRVNVVYFVGILLKQHGQRKDAIAYLTEASDSKATYKYTYILARHMLREMGLLPPEQPAQILSEEETSVIDMSPHTH